MPNYEESQDVINAMQPILDRCAERNNGIDRIAFLVGFEIHARSKVDGYGGKFDATAVASSLGNFTETNKDTFGKNTDFKHISFLNVTEDSGSKKIIAWSVIFPYENYKLVFAGNLKNESRYPIHRATVEEYVRDILPLIEEYDRLV
ncbi:MAG: hypothetical protein F6J86_35740 [Symploca sp. SIO1B1]|nr:hypothetical protein [Symploca sp. SIO1B1]